MKDTAIVIMAGGKGERFWPKSTTQTPKHFCSVLGGVPMVRQTYDRIRSVFSESSIFMVTPSDQVQRARVLLDDLNPDRFIVEPVGRDTAACIALVSLTLRHKFSRVLLIPSDHYIGNTSLYGSLLRECLGALDQSDVSTIGVPPSRPDTAYGYICKGQHINGRTHNITRFIEKPDMETAMKMLQSGDYLWNSGTFCWSLSALDQALRQSLQYYDELGQALNDGEDLRGIYVNLPRLSFDKSVMQAYGGRAVVVDGQGLIWDDIGNWGSLLRVLPTDRSGNVIVGNPMILDTSDSVVYCSDDSTVVIGAQSLFVVHTENGVLICSRDRESQIRSAVGHFFSPNCDIAATNTSDNGTRTVDKPWGREVWWAQTPHYIGKTIEVRAGCRLSLQFHERKTESMYCLSGEGQLELDGSVIGLAPGVGATIPAYSVHRVIANTDLVILEVSTNHPTDVVRVQDDYNRSRRSTN